MDAADKSKTLEDLVKNEQPDDKNRAATQALLWLTRCVSFSIHSCCVYLSSKYSLTVLWDCDRGLDFTAQALRSSLDNPTEELSEAFTKAYGGTLKPHHSFVVKPIFTVCSIIPLDAT